MVSRCELSKDADKLDVYFPRLLSDIFIILL